ncbi:hypothetical protein PYCCODRAFT_1437210 [Trametes coccinea BRFM310]|uniref:Uncharacterized protein n=1 Tax=Trametes coccinea (strain BRFM310) TaxID=1353009 RepID=A0A1Y2IJ99_TRAC3|nr:hypothetical protein PYCCODRAFT_1437210 [Trametes coccinea BRFM310]
MPRDAFVLAALNAVREQLPQWQTESANLFAANSAMTSKNVSFGSGGMATLAKDGYTKSKYGNIYYIIQMKKDEVPLPQVFKIYVMRPSANPAVNRTAVENAIDYFLGTESTIMTRDVVATPSA